MKFVASLSELAQRRERERKREEESEDSTLIYRNIDATLACLRKFRTPLVKLRGIDALYDSNQTNARTLPNAIGARLNVPDSSSNSGFGMARDRAARRQIIIDAIKRPTSACGSTTTVPSSLLPSLFRTRVLALG
jgi:uncharacterized protein YigA (DUF484 family)